MESERIGLSTIFPGDRFLVSLPHSTWGIKNKSHSLFFLPVILSFSPHFSQVLVRFDNDHWSVNEAKFTSSNATMFTEYDSGGSEETIRNHYTEGMTMSYHIYIYIYMTSFSFISCIKENEFKLTKFCFCLISE